ncbi:hypothetical protein V5799_005648 [Amblyomma americanum]|uniref:Major facilitator superfamily (MFS) profile domain-containing protein n=1 Tax=Amblyomma americanum TaxID=6943 RepID=A0AAQ4DYN2_AMBAM
MNATVKIQLQEDVERDVHDAVEDIISQAALNADLASVKEVLNWEYKLRLCAAAPSATLTALEMQVFSQRLMCSSSEAAMLAAQTIMQGQCARWHEERSVRICSSVAHRIVAGKSGHLIPLCSSCGMQRRSVSQPSCTTEGSRRGSDRVEPPYGVGAFQLLALFSLTIAGGAFLLHNESFRLTAVAMDHWCRRPPNFTNVSVAKWKHIAIPMDENGQHSHCTVRDPPDGGSMARVVPCTSWEYDHGTYGHNIVSEWNLVCERRWLIDLAKMIYSASAMISLPLLGALADRVGRKPVIFIAVPVVLAAGGAVNLPINFPTFVAVRAIVSISTSALVPPLLSLVYEVSPVEKIPAYNDVMHQNIE